MSCLIDSIPQSDPFWQELIEEIRNASTLALVVLVALRFGRAVAVRVVEEVLNERGQAPDEGGVCPKCGEKLESNGLKPREVLTLIGWVKWRRRVRGCSKGCKIGQVVLSDKVLHSLING